QIATGATYDFAHAAQMLNEVQTQTTILSKALQAWLDAYDLAIRIGRTDTQALAEAQGAYDASLKESTKSTDDSTDRMQHAAGASDLLADGMGGIAGWATQLAGQVGSQLLGFFSQFTDAVMGTTGAILDLTSVLNFSDLFSSSTQALKDWQQQLQQANA